MKYLFLIFLTSVTTSGFTQIQSNGKIPLELFISTTKKYDIKKAEILDSSRYEPREIRLARLKNLKANTYLVDAMKNQGEIYVNDKYSELLNDIGDLLLKDQPGIRNNIHLYAYKSPEVNAFSTDQGDLFFTIGLLAHLDNEAELAFVVAHEIVHYLKQHNYLGFNHRLKILREKTEYKTVSINENLASKHSFSQLLEREADILALEYYTSSQYDTSAIFSVLHKLKNAHLGYREIAINGSLFNTGKIALPKGFFPSDRLLNRQEKNKEKSPTHPEIEDRINYCRQSLISKVIPKGTLYKRTNETKFFALKTAARKHHILMLYDHQYFSKAIYNAFILSADGELTKQESKNFITSCLLRVSQLKSASIKTNDNYATCSGELYKLWHILNRSSAEQLLTLNFIHSYYNYLENQDVPSKQYFEESQIILANAHEKNKYEILKTDLDTSQIENTTVKTLHTSVFVVLNSQLYIEEFNSITSHNTLSKKKQPATRISEIDNLIVCNPYYVHLANKESGYLDYVRSYNNEELLINSIRAELNTLSVNTSILDFRVFNDTDGDKVDDISTLENYISQFIQLDMKIGSKVFPSSQEQLDSIRAKYHTDLVIWIAARSYDESLGYTESAKTLNATTIFMPYMPFGIYKLLRKKDDSILFYVIIDLKENRVVQKIEKTFKGTTLGSKKEMSKYISKLLKD